MILEHIKTLNGVDLALYKGLLKHDEFPTTDTLLTYDTDEYVNKHLDFLYSNRLSVKSTSNILTSILNNEEISSCDLPYTLMYPLNPIIDARIKSNDLLMSVQNAFIVLVDSKAFPENYSPEALNIINNRVTRITEILISVYEKIMRLHK